MEQRTVGEIAAAYPAAVRVFQKHAIDFCCGGKLPLEEACRSRGLNTAAVLADLEAALAPAGAKSTDWQTAPLGALIDHILETHHAYLRAELPRVDQMLAKVIDKHGANHPDMVPPLRPLFDGLAAELASHMMKEERILFPLIRSLEAGTLQGPAHCGSIRNPISVMEYEHDSAGNALAQMRRITRDYQVPPDACNTFRALFHGLEELEADLHQHIHLENNILFPRAVDLEG